MHPSDFIHPEDAAALRQMENMPGFASVAKKVMNVFAETLFYGMNMASAIRLSERQFPDIYRHLPPICQRLGIPVPEFYLEMSPYPNACTFGDTRIFIKVTSALVELLNEEELDAVIAHECGHIICRHVLYHTMAVLIRRGIGLMGVLGNLAEPLRYALLYWQRKSELSADRVSCYITSAETTANTMAKLAGGLSDVTSKIDFQEWAKQAGEYELIRKSSTWNKFLQMLAVAELSHPFSAVRVREILNWSKSDQYYILKNSKMLTDGNNLKCPNCHKPVEPDWQFCRSCGFHLK